MKNLFGCSASSLSSYASVSSTLSPSPSKRIRTKRRSPWHPGLVQDSAIRQDTQPPHVVYLRNRWQGSQGVQPVLLSMRHALCGLCRGAKLGLRPPHSGGRRPRRLHCAAHAPDTQIPEGTVRMDQRRADAGVSGAAGHRPCDRRGVRAHREGGEPEARALHGRGHAAPVVLHAAAAASPAGRARPSQARLPGTSNVGLSICAHVLHSHMFKIFMRECKDSLACGCIRCCWMCQQNPAKSNPALQKTLCER